MTKLSFWRCGRVMVPLQAPHSTGRRRAATENLAAIPRSPSSQTPGNCEHNCCPNQRLLMAYTKTVHHGIYMRMCNVSKHQTKHHKAKAPPHAYYYHRSLTTVQNDFPGPYHRPSGVTRIQQCTHHCGSRLQQGCCLLALSQNYWCHRSCHLVLNTNISLLQCTKTGYLGSRPMIHCTIHLGTLCDPRG